MKMKKAYILSTTNGTVQIGRTVYQPATGAIFDVDSYPRKYICAVEVPDASMESARLAIQKAKVY